MIKDVMVRLDGTSGDDVRLAAVNQIAEIFESHITGLFFNVLSSLVPDGRNGAGAGQAAKLLDTAKQAGDIIEATVFERLTRLQHPSNLRRFDVIGDGDISDTTLPLARAVDVFVALRPNGQSNEPQGLIESLLFGMGAISSWCQTIRRRWCRSRTSLWRGTEAGSRRARSPSLCLICARRARLASLS